MPYAFGAASAMVGAMFLPRKRLQNDLTFDLGRLHGFGDQKAVVFCTTENHPWDCAVAIGLSNTVQR